MLKSLVGIALELRKAYIERTCCVLIWAAGNDWKWAAVEWGYCRECDQRSDREMRYECVPKSRVSCMATLYISYAKPTAPLTL
jgi:hypothetical protein